MNGIFWQELKTGWKPFILWTLGLAVLVMAGMYKFKGFSEASGVSINDLFAQFPQVILAMLGMANADIQTLPGYYAVIGTYVLVLTSVYAIQLGAHAVSREMIDKTYEFVFTKPCGRSSILGGKISCGLLYLAVFCVMEMVFSYAAIAAYQLGELNSTIWLYALNSFLVGLVFFSCAVAFSAFFDRAEMGMKVSNACFILAYILSVFYDMAENPGLLKVVTPLRYFTASDLIGGRLDWFFLALALFLSTGLLVAAFSLFRKKDLKTA